MKRPSKKAVLIAGSATALTTIALLVGGLFFYNFHYNDRILPGVSVNGVGVGGMSYTDAQDILQTRYQEMLDAGLSVTHASTTKNLEIQLSGSTDPDLVYDVVLYDPSAAARSAIEFGRSGNFVEDTADLIWTLFEPTSLASEITILEQPIEDVILQAFGEIETEAVKTRYTITDLKSGEIEVTEGTVGEEIDFDTFFLGLSKDLQDLSLKVNEIELTETQPVVTESEALEHTEELLASINNAPLTLTYTTPALRDYEWEISAAEIEEWAAVERNGSTTSLVLDHEGLDELFTEIGEIVNVAPQNARFQVEDGVAVEFQGSTAGVSLDTKATKLELNEILDGEVTELALVTIVEEPEVSTESVNNLGIKEVLGTGYSNFAGSPSNRVANIQHGVNKLNGLLIAPGETLSLIEQLKPFTISGGYLPELVIKGDEVIPEIGGGLCQIGSTTFRAVMNSGLQVDERRNHSLVVNYYNDPSNDLPGTDATLYDPAPDFKFTNDTGNYILLEAKIVDGTELEFTFWGTNDGRNAYYTPPKVLSWTGYGATQYKETTSLPPGEVRCQNAYRGAKTTFDYIVERPDGTVETTTYDSTYRSLPRICLVGADPDALRVDDVE